MSTDTPTADEAIDTTGKTPSRQDEKGRYLNPVDTEQFTGSHFTSILWRYFQRPKNTGKPDVEIPVHSLDAVLFRQPASQAPLVYWLGHSSLLLETGGLRYLIDPVLSERTSMVQWIGPKRLHPAPIQAQDIPQVDAIIISHNHYDHMDELTLRELVGRAKRFFVPLGVGDLLSSWGAPQGSITEMDWWQEVRHEGNTIVATPARHFTGRSPLRTDAFRSLWASWCIINEQHRVFYSGDSGAMPQFSQIGNHYGPFELTMIGIGAYDPAWAHIHTSPAQAVEAHLQLRGDKLLPVHWATFDLALHSWGWPIRDFADEARRRKVPILTPEPGERLDPQRHINREWWRLG